MITLISWCKNSTVEELHDMMHQANDKPRWEMNNASMLIIEAAVKELKKRGNIVQTG
jgi:hypothetical protein|tara:strand:- start:780 stop:950 length:171 start_codon:yes stop_codon:yes gene_type:complete